MHTHIRKLTARVQRWQLIALTVFCIAGSFGIGIQSSGNVQTISHTEAGGRMTGDINGDDRMDIADAIVTLEIARGYREATAKELLGDPNQDGKLTIDDALRMLHDIQIAH